MAELPLSEKLTHDRVEYTHPSPYPDKKCGNCAHLIEATPLRCQHVKPPIRRPDWCEHYESRK